jgi:indolepyruvate ferredoxin oxidoreductase
VDRAQAAEMARGITGFADAVAEGYFKVLSYKDEYEVARLHTQTLAAALDEAFDHVGRISFHLAPPIMGRKDNEGRPVKSVFGPWMARAFRVLAWFKFLRGTPFDPFGRSNERRIERQMIRDYEALVAEIIGNLSAANAPAATELARMQMQVRGFGHVKLANAERVADERAVLLARFRSGETSVPHAAE